MDASRTAIFEHDMREAADLGTITTIRLKLLYYAAARRLFHRSLRARLAEDLAEDPIFRRIDLFLKDDGGMFKRYAYGIANRTCPLRSARVLVPGVGYGRNLAQLAAFRPREIVAFDLYEYPEDWEHLARTLFDRFGVRTAFFKGDFDAIPAPERSTFDAIISDAVLEHVPDLPGFMANSATLLREGGIFFASFGPIWYGPSGDHVEWGPDNLFDHLLLSREKYVAQSKKRVAVSAHDSCDPGFMGQEELFSYLASADYAKHLLDHPAFEPNLFAAKISSKALSFFSRHPDFHTVLDKRGLPRFDRFCSGFYAWLTRRSPIIRT